MTQYNYKILLIYFMHLSVKTDSQNGHATCSISLKTYFSYHSKICMIMKTTELFLRTQIPRDLFPKSYHLSLIFNINLDKSSFLRKNIIMSNSDLFITYYFDWLIINNQSRFVVDGYMICVCTTVFSNKRSKDTIK
jgi:hypothetical protein